MDKRQLAYIKELCLKNKTKIQKHFRKQNRSEGKKRIRREKRKKEKKTFMGYKSHVLKMPPGINAFVHSAG